MSAELALQGAMVAALKASPAGAALGGRILDHVRPGTPLPYLHLRGFQGVEDGADGIEALEIHADLDVWSDAVGKPEAARIAGRVRAALHGADLVLAAPWALTDLAHASTLVTDAPEAGLVRARMTFRALVERI